MAIINFGEKAMKVPVFSFPWKCYKCAEEMRVTYPTTEDVYKTEFRGNLAPTFSNTRQENVIGNLCPNCKAYQGNYFVMDNGLMENAYQLEAYLVGFFEKKIKCLVCGKEIEHVNKENLFTKLQIYQDYIDLERLSPAEKEKACRVKIMASDSFSLCKDCYEIESTKGKSA
jgi:hypothetical protein